MVAILARPIMGHRRDLGVGHAWGGGPARPFNVGVATRPAIWGISVGRRSPWRPRKAPRRLRRVFGGWLVSTKTAMDATWGSVKSGRRAERRGDGRSNTDGLKQRRRTQADGGGVVQAAGTTEKKKKKKKFKKWVGAGAWPMAVAVGLAAESPLDLDVVRSLESWEKSADSRRWDGEGWRGRGGAIRVSRIQGWRYTSCAGMEVRAVNITVGGVVRLWFLG